MRKALKEAKEWRKYGRTNKELIHLQCESDSRIKN